MAEFINTAAVIGDDELCAQIIMRTVTEYRENRIKTMGDSALANCTALTVVDVPNVTSLMRYCVQNCSALTALILRNPTMVTLQYNNVLNGTAIANKTGYIYVPASLVDTYKANSNWAGYATQFRAIEDYPDICG